MAVLRGIIEPADGIELSLVEQLAEDEGVDGETVRRTIARLRADGSLRSERGADGEEVYAWEHPAPPS